MITAKNSLEDMEKGFRAGTDDYMIKPISLREMALRVKALLRKLK
jgi:DNA-binding response OmpR family regulator